jgi:hypothetical protein
MANEYANYATLNPLYPSSNVTLSNGNLTATYAGSNHYHFPSNMLIPTTGKWAMKATDINTAGRPADNMIGVIEDNPAALTDGHDNATSVFWTDRGTVYRAGTNLGTVADTFTLNDVLQLLYDRDAATLKLYKNGSLSYTVTSVPTTANVFSAVANEGGVAVWTLDFGQNGYVATDATYLNLSTANLPTPAIINPDDHFHSEVVDHDGSSTASTCTFNLDTYEWLAWIKNIDGSAETWYIINSLNGANKYHTWESATQSTDANVMTVSGTTFTLGSTLGDKSYLVEFHKAGLSSAKAANTEGATNTIATTVNLVSGFGMSEFTGSGSNTTVGHGMDIAPAMTIPNNNTIADGHYVLHTGTGDPDLRLNIGTTQAAADDAANFNGSYPSATVISLGSADRTNKSGSNIVLYYWHDVNGYSSFGSYEGNGAAAGTFINTGLYGNKNFVKNIDSAYSWQSVSTTEQGYNTGANPSLQFDNDGVGGGAAYDIVSNGLKMRTANANYNSAETFIYGSWGGRPMTDGAINQGRAGAVKPYNQAYGGTITQAGGFWVHTFTSSGTFIPVVPMDVEYLVIAGGGGTSRYSGGGGAGGHLSATGFSVAAAALTVTVGAGGAAGTSTGVAGGNSVFSSITATGGGFGKQSDEGGNGGSGGGGGSSDSVYDDSTGIDGQGNDGGSNSTSASGYPSGGGGGAGAVGGDASGSATGGVGGAGEANSITGTAVTRAGGGGGGTRSGTAGAGGAGGGGAGSVGGAAATAGTANTGGGAGGGGSTGAGAAGGSGIVIVKYAIS